MVALVSIKVKRYLEHKGFPITDANFLEAWNLLKDLYDNNRDILFALLKKVIYQSPVSKKCPKAIRKFIDTSLECVRSLSVLGQDTDKMSSILDFIIMEKMDADTQREFTKTFKGSIIPFFKEVIDFLENHVSSLLTVSGKSGQPVKSNYGSKNNLNKKNIKCPMCTDAHMLPKCGKFLALTPSDREQWVKSKKMCLNCFSGRNMKQYEELGHMVLIPE